MARQDDNIVNCAERLVKKLNSGYSRKFNNEYSKEVQKEIERMKNHCADSYSPNDPRDLRGKGREL